MQRRGAAGRQEVASGITRHALIAAWDLAVLAALGLYFGRFSRLPLQSTLFPRLVGYPVAALALASLGVEIFHLMYRTGGAEGGEPEALQARTRLSRLSLAAALGIVYLLLWEPLGFELDTVVFLLLVPLGLGQPLRRLPVLLVIAVATAVLFAALFHLGSGAILPSGALGVQWP